MEKIQQAIERARQQRAALTREVGRPGPAPAPDKRASSGIDARLESARAANLDAKHLRNHKIVSALVDDPRADIFRTLRTQVLLRLDALGGRSVAVVSARDGEGKTLVAINLAVSLARRADGPVFLVDLDFRRPSVAKALGLKPTVGVSDLIEGRAEPSDVIVHVEGLNLYVLPQSKAIPHASELIGSTRTRDVLRDLAGSARGGHLVVDCPPLLMTDEPLAVQTFVDGCLLVVQYGRTTRDEIRRAAELLDSTKYLGSVINRAEAGESTTYYGYR